MHCAKGLRHGRGSDSVAVVPLVVHNFQGPIMHDDTILTKRQSMVADYLMRAHSLGLHPSPRQIANHLGVLGARAVRSELTAMAAAGAIVEAVAVLGSGATRYRLARCECRVCKPD